MDYELIYSERVADNICYYVNIAFYAASKSNGQQSKVLGYLRLIVCPFCFFMV